MLKRIIACIVLATFLSVSTGCYGSFSLTKKLYKWNGTVGDKYVNAGVFFVFLVIPVYEVCTIIDAVVLNTIQFWTGNNPMALNSDTEIQKVFERNGKAYKVTMGKGMITILEIKGPDVGKKITLTYKKNEMAWYLSNGASSHMVASFDPKPLNNVHLYYPDGKVVSQDMSIPELAFSVQ